MSIWILILVQILQFPLPLAKSSGLEDLVGCETTGVHCILFSFPLGDLRLVPGHLFQGVLAWFSRVCVPGHMIPPASFSTSVYIRGKVAYIKQGRRVPWCDGQGAEHIPMFRFCLTASFSRRPGFSAFRSAACVLDGIPVPFCERIPSAVSRYCVPTEPKVTVSYQHVIIDLAHSNTLSL